MNEDVINCLRFSGCTLLTSLLFQGFSGLEIVDYALKLEAKNGKRLLLSREEALIKLEKTSALGIEIISFSSKIYPEELKRIGNPPPLLYAKGNLDLLLKPKFAIVGARSASFESSVIAGNFAEKLSEFGFTIVSGFAHGIDTFACRGAAKFGTIQVLGSGINVVYPKANTELYNEVLNLGGLFISEFQVNAPAKPDHFPLRNRIISGISKGVLLVQASRKNGSSGSLITAKIALEQEKDLFAIPGHPLDSKFDGGNELIKHGNAIFTTSPQDVIDLIGYHLTKKERNFVFRPKNLKALDQIEQTTPSLLNQSSDLKSEIKSVLSTQPVSVDQIYEMLKIDIKQLQIALVEMELLNEIQRHHNGKFSISLL